MKKLIVATITSLIILSNTTQEQVFANSYDKHTQSQIVNELQKANRQALDLQKVLDSIQEILRNNKPMEASELEQLLNPVRQKNN